jgi:hypothetical protein
LRVVRQLALGLLVVATVAAVILATLVFTGSFTARPDEPQAALPDTVQSARRNGSSAAQRPNPPPPPTIVLAAVRGSSWLSVRRASPEGEVLFEGILERDRFRRFAASRLWIRFGAASNIQASVNGKAVTLPAGTVDVFVPPVGRP